MDSKGVLRVCPQTVFAFAVLLTGWGWDDLAGFFAHPARAGLVVVAFLSLFLVVALRVPLDMVRKGSGPVGRQRWALAGLFLLSLALMLLLPYGDRRDWLIFDAPDWLRYLAVAVYLAGNVLAFTAVKTLGRQYSGYVTLQENHQLIQTGIYSLIRHPIYLRILMVGSSRFCTRRAPGDPAGPAGAGRGGRGQRRGRPRRRLQTHAL